MCGPHWYVIPCGAPVKIVTYQGTGEAEPSPESFQQGAFAFLRGDFGFVRGGLTLKKLTKLNRIIAFHVSIWELGALFGEAKPPKAPVVTGLQGRHSQNRKLVPKYYSCATEGKKNFLCVQTITGFVNQIFRDYVKMNVTRVSSHWLWLESSQSH